MLKKRYGPQPPRIYVFSSRKGRCPKTSRFHGETCPRIGFVWAPHGHHIAKSSVPLMVANSWPSRIVEDLHRSSTVKTPVTPVTVKNVAVGSSKWWIIRHHVMYMAIWVYIHGFQLLRNAQWFKTCNFPGMA